MIESRRMMKPMKLRHLSLVLALLAFAGATAVDVAIFRGMSARNRLESRNDAERRMNILLSSLRDYPDFGAAIEALPSLRGKVLGVAAFDAEGRTLYSFGKMPELGASAKELAAELEGGRPGDAAAGQASSAEESAAAAKAAAAAASAGLDGDGRIYRENPADSSLVILLDPKPKGPPPPRRDGGRTDGRPEDQPKDGDEGREPSFFFSTLRDAELLALEVEAGEYWAAERFHRFLFPAAELLLACLVVLVRGLVLRNAEYRKRIEEQRSLVMLGTAASTIAHEIKNPLLSIKLQTSILLRTCPESASRELRIIDDEVARLSALSGRVSDYLRDPEGRPVTVEAAEVASTVSLRRLGRDIVAVRGKAAVLADPARLRSVLENLLENAIESGGPEEELAVEVGAAEGEARIDVLDRGSGIAPGDRERVFDPFYTTKSRGTGIGLSVCRRFSEAAGGGISLEERQGGGTRARLVLPLAAAAPPGGEARGGETRLRDERRAAGDGVPGGGAP